MKNNLEKAKDVLYNISDYLIMGTIIIAIALIISWRLDILFPDTNIVADVNPTVKAEDSVSKNIDTPINNDGIAGDEAKVEDSPASNVQAKKEDPPAIVNVSIPKGSPSTNIGNILVDKGLVNSVQEFESKVKELSLEKNLRSGEYDIEKDASLESIVKIIANVK